MADSKISQLPDGTAVQANDQTVIVRAATNYRVPLGTAAGKVAPTGTIVGDTDTQTLTNKTLSGGGTSEDTVYTCVGLTGGGASASFSGLGRYSTTGVTNSAKTIYARANYAMFLLVNGYDSAGGRMFTDLLLAGQSAAPTVVTSRTEFGAPATRTYTQSGINVQLTMGAVGSYNISTVALEGGIHS